MAAAGNHKKTKWLRAIYCDWCCSPQRNEIMMMAGCPVARRASLLEEEALLL